MLQDKFAGTSLRLTPGDDPVAVFPAMHSDIGDISIYDDGDELTVVFGNFTHSHFGNYEEKLSEAEKERQIAEEMVELLEDIFQDKILFYGSHQGGGGWQGIEGKSRGFISKTFAGQKSYVWSGPVT
jgi:hypothetical protein